MRRVIGRTRSEPMSIVLVSWRREFPIVDTCTYLVSHSLGAMPGPRATTCSSSPTSGIARRAGVVRRLVGDRPDDRATCSRRSSACRRARSRCTRTSRWRRRSSRRAIRFDGRRRKIVMTDLEFPVEPVSLRGIPPLRRRDRLRAVRRRDADEPRPAPRRDRRADRCSCRSRSCCSRAPTSRTRDAIIEKAHRVGARVILDVYQAAGTVPMDLERLAGGLRRRRLGEVAVRRARRRISLRATRSGVDDLQPGIVGWAAHAQPFEFETGRDSTTPTRRSGSRAARRTSRRSTRAARATRSSRDRRAGDPREVAPPHAALMDRATGGGLPHQHAARRTHERGGAVIVDVPNGAAVADELIRRERHRRLPAGRRHPHRAALLQHRGRDRPRDGHARARSSGSLAAVEVADMSIGSHRSTVLGAGTMGHGIAHAAIAGGYRDAAVRRRRPRAGKGRGAIDGIVGKSVELGKVTDADADAVLGRLHDDEHAGRGAWRTPTSSSRRRPSGSTSSSRCSPRSNASRRRRAVIATNTSALSITEMAGRSTDPTRVAGHALLQPGAQDEADRDRAGARELTRRRCRRSRTCRGGWARRPCSCASRPASSRRASTPASATRRSTC